MNKIKIKIIQEGDNLRDVKKLISKFQIKNDIKYDITILLDWSSDDMGYFYFGETRKKIYVNPKNCNFDKKSYGFTNDHTIMGTVTHEYSHCLDEIYGIESKYEEYIKDNDRLIINNYVKKSGLEEEVAELLSLYINNPYLFKLIDKKRYTWFKRMFKSPTPCSEKELLKRMSLWSPKVKKACWDKWGIKVVKQKIYLGRKYYVATKQNKD